MIRKLDGTIRFPEKVTERCEWNVRFRRNSPRDGCLPAFNPPRES